MSRSDLTWTQMHFTAPLLPGTAEAVMRALVGLPGLGTLRPVFEVEATAGGLHYRVGAARERGHELRALLAAHLPDVALSREQVARGGQPFFDPLASFSGLAAAAELAVIGGKAAPLNVPTPTGMEQLSRDVLTALTGLRSGERIVVQIALGGVRPPRAVGRGESAEPSLAAALLGRPTHPDAAKQRRLTDKHSEHRFQAVVRLGADAASRDRARYLLARVAGAWQPLASPGVRLTTKGRNPRDLVDVRRPWQWPLELTLSELIALLAWPLAPEDAQLPGLPPRHPKLLPTTSAHPTQGRVLGDGTAPNRQSRPVALPLGDGLRHLHVVAPTGAGKSTLLANLALADIQNGESVVVVDPKGDLVADLLARIPRGREHDIVVLDPTDPAPVGLSLLTRPTGAGAWDADQAADTVARVIRGLYGDQIGARSNDILHSTLLTMARANALPDALQLSLPLLPVLLSNPALRRRVTSRVTPSDPMGIGAFWAWYESISEAERQHAIAPLMNKLRPILLRPGVRAVLGQRQPRFALQEVFTQSRVVLVNLGKGTLGQDAARLMGSLLVALLWQASLERVRVPQDQRRPVHIVIDEAQDYVGWDSSFGDALAQARGLGVGFTLAHQHLGQLPPRLLADVFANAQNRVAFRLNTHDSKQLAALTSGQLLPDDFAALDAYRAYAGLVIKGQRLPWVSLTTRPLPAATSSPEAIRKQSRRAWGHPLGAIEADLASILEPASQANGETAFGVRRSPSEGGAE